MIYVEIYGSRPSQEKFPYVPNKISYIDKVIVKGEFVITCYFVKN